ncbi:TIGR02594 family protein [Bradyrhizobium diazoefficiens]|uniref:NlpC/P60 family protein n=1 Tax=Bradyrhizobium diazoefficiens TaxID=1355477 RepID=UPI000BE85269|nr:TIGR02594 family protein [Bradyrhizobium diazoefficiens]PDT59295.1 TIGR02594 family protein [Bradyrhizobium diazoefficiens]QLD46540.1 TIGR02594 family protein [Bradyrhizobium diazoefficiens]
MFELFASRLSRCVVALALFFAAVAVFSSPASARPHRHSAERHAYAHHASRYHHYRHQARSSRFERSAAQLQAGGFMDTQASYDPNANSGGMGDTRYLSGGDMAIGGNVSRAGKVSRARNMSHAVNNSSASDNGSAGNMGMSSGFGGGSGLVSEARRYLGGNPTGRGSLWCARFMNMVLEKTGHRGTGSDMANSFARYGTRVSGPQVGAIAVMSRGGRGGHVGIITGVDAQGNPIMISGNNGNRVREAPVSRGRIYAYVMPN